MGDWHEDIGVYQGARDLRRVATSEAEAEHEAREIRRQYRQRGKGWAVYLVEHDCDRDGECSCVKRLDVSAPRFSSNAIGLARGAGLCP